MYDFPSSDGFQFPSISCQTYHDFISCFYSTTHIKKPSRICRRVDWKVSPCRQKKKLALCEENHENASQLDVFLVVFSFLTWTTAAPSSEFVESGFRVTNRGATTQIEKSKRVSSVSTRARTPGWNPPASSPEVDQVAFLRCALAFLDAFSHLYKRVCPSVRRSVGPSVRWSVTLDLQSCLSAVFIVCHLLRQKV